METFNSASEDDTAGIARALARRLQPGMVVTLHGNLGAGKTVFARALIRALAAAPELEVPSPTFTLVQTYETPAGPVWHFDLYRLKNAGEVYELGWDEALADGIVLIEWPERLADLMPKVDVAVTLTTTADADRRQITLEEHA